MLYVAKYNLISWATTFLYCTSIAEIWVIVAFKSTINQPNQCNAVFGGPGNDAWDNAKNSLEIHSSKSGVDPSLLHNLKLLPSSHWYEWKLLISQLLPLFTVWFIAQFDIFFIKWMEPFNKNNCLTPINSIFKVMKTSILHVLLIAQISSFLSYHLNWIAIIMIPCMYCLIPYVSTGCVLFVCCENNYYTQKKKQILIFLYNFPSSEHL